MSDLADDSMGGVAGEAGNDTPEVSGRMQAGDMSATVGAAGGMQTGNWGWMFEKHEGLYTWVAPELSRKIEEYFARGAVLVTYVWDQKWIDDDRKPCQDCVEYRIYLDQTPVIQENMRSHKKRKMYRAQVSPVV